MTKVPLAELCRLLVMESSSKSDIKKKDRKKKWKSRGEAEGEMEEVKDNHTSWMIWRWGERQVRTALSLSQVECDE